MSWGELEKFERGLWADIITHLRGVLLLLAVRQEDILVRMKFTMKHSGEATALISLGDNGLERFHNFSITL